MTKKGRKSMNIVIMSGRTTKEPEIKTFSSGSKLASFTLAVDRMTKEGKTAVFFDCKAWGKQAETVERYVKKGQPLAVTGELQTRSYEDREGNKRKAFEIVVNRVEFLGKGNDSQEGAGERRENARREIEEDTAAPSGLPFEI